MSSKTTSTEKKDVASEKVCFIISPIGQVETEINRKANGLYNAVIKPVLNDLGYECVRADEIDASGSINNQIINKIIDSKLVIVNLSGLNPNVMYELALRHAIGKPVIMLKEGSFSDMPFDIIDQRTILYNDDLNSVVSTQNELRKKIEGIKSNSEIDNPFLTAQKLKKAMKDVDSQGKENYPDAIVMNEILKEIRTLRNYSIHEKSYSSTKSFQYLNSIIDDTQNTLSLLIENTTDILYDLKNMSEFNTSNKESFFIIQDLINKLKKLNSKLLNSRKG